MSDAMAVLRDAKELYAQALRGEASYSELIETLGDMIRVMEASGDCVVNGHKLLVKETKGFEPQRGCVTCNKWLDPVVLDGTPTV